MENEQQEISAEQIEATEGGATENGATENGATEDGATEDGAPENGAAENGATENHATDSGPENSIRAAIDELPPRTDTAGAREKEERATEGVNQEGHDIIDRAIIWLFGESDAVGDVGFNDSPTDGDGAANDG